MAGWSATRPRIATWTGAGRRRWCCRRSWPQPSPAKSWRRAMGLPRRSPANRRELIRFLEQVEAKCRELGSRWQTLPGQERYELLQFANKANWLLIRCGVNNEMSGDPYYRSKAWRSLRGQVLRRD